jgi:hypothetical protein
LATSKIGVLLVSRAHDFLESSDAGHHLQPGMGTAINGKSPSSANNSHFFAGTLKD